jgi:hypothetical protein
MKFVTSLAAMVVVFSGIALIPDAFLLLIPGGIVGSLICVGILRRTDKWSVLSICFASLMAPLISSIILNWFASVRRPNLHNNFLTAILATFMVGLIFFTLPAVVTGLVAAAIQIKTRAGSGFRNFFRDFLRRP